MSISLTRREPRDLTAPKRVALLPRLLIAALVLTCLGVPSSVPRAEATTGSLSARFAGVAVGKPNTHHVVVSVRSRPGAHCGFTVRARKSSLSMPAVETNARGRGKWTWGIPTRAPSGRWRLHGVCKQHGQRKTDTTRFRVRTAHPSARGSLYGASTGRVLVGRDLRWPITGRGGTTANPFPPDQCTAQAYDARPDIGEAILEQARKEGISEVDAKLWFGLAQRAGLATGTQPQKGALAAWNSMPELNGSDLGHVGLVGDLLPDGSWTLIDRNRKGPGQDATENSANVPPPTGFIYGPPGSEPQPAPSPGPQPGQEFVVDNSDPGFVPTTPPGTEDRWHSWNEASATNGQALYRYRWLPTRGDTPAMSGGAMWTVDAPAGSYEVFAHIPANIPHNANSNENGGPLRAQYIVHAADGDHERLEDQHWQSLPAQQQSTGGWIDLGAYRFNGRASVTLTDNARESDTNMKYIAFDSVRFRYAGP